jgi:endosialidase-like protein
MQSSEMPGPEFHDFSYIGKFFPTSSGKSWRKMMKGNQHMKAKTKFIYSAFAVFALAWLALSPTTQGVVPPPPGGYPNFTTAAGDNALQALTSGVGNTAIGTFSLFSVTTGNFNTAVGAGSLDLNTADSNTATGAAALLFNTTGTENTANGTAALEFNETGSNNTAVGAFALFRNTTGEQNTALGRQALYFNATGNFNTATGSVALQANMTGTHNTATGMQALVGNTTGSANTAFGFNALEDNDGSFNTAVGQDALGNNTTGFFNLALGAGAGTGVNTAEHVICIGANVGGANVSDTTWIASVYGVTTQSGTTAPVIVSDDGQLGTVASSERFKKDIVTMDKASEAVLSLRPVTFHYKTDTKGPPQFGLIAEEVAKVNPALVLSDKEGKPYTVRYEAVNAMLLNEFLKEHRKNEDQQATITQLKQDFQSRLAQQQKQIEALTVGLQQVSAQVEMSRPAPQTVVDNH